MSITKKYARMVLDDYSMFLEKVLNHLNRLGIDVSKLDMDHIGYQASSDEDYTRLTKEFDTMGKKISEVIVGGRKVGMYLLNKPLQYKQYTQHAVEVYAPTAGQICPSALEHVEFVIEEPFESFMKKYPSLKWNTAAINQSDFPQIKLRLSENIQVKFHLTPLLDILKRKAG